MNKKASRLDRVERTLGQVIQMLEQQGLAVQYLLNEHDAAKAEKQPELDVNAKLDD